MHLVWTAEPTYGNQEGEGKSASRKCNLVDQYLAILLLVFSEAGLADVRQCGNSVYP